MKLRYSGSRALLLGGSCDMGLALAEAMIVAGLHPLLTYRNAQSKARIQERLRSYDRQYDSLHLDLDVVEEGSSLNDYLSQGLDYLVDMAQGELEGLVPTVDGRAMGDFFDANIRARAIIIQQAARAMLARKKGRMVYISSSAAGRSSPGQGFYAAVKQAAEALYRNIGLELADRGITAVTLRPGYVDAGRGRRFLERNARQALAKVPLGRALTLVEVVDTILFLLCDSAVGFNATALTMDGGLSAGK